LSKILSLVLSPLVLSLPFTNKIRDRAQQLRRLANTLKRIEGGASDFLEKVKTVYAAYAS
jgi:hypothetical protein